MPLCRWCGEPEDCPGSIHDSQEDCSEAIPFDCPKCRESRIVSKAVATCCLGLGDNFYVCKRCGHGFSSDQIIRRQIPFDMLGEILE